ncbi:MAG: hypothetical protein QXT26_07825 [Thermoproteota archaeon]
MSIAKLSKEEISAKLNEVLGLKDKPIDFTKLSKDELIRLYEVVEGLALGGGLLGTKILNRPIGEIMDMRLRDILRDIREGKGILGLGILKSILGSRD